MQKHNYPIQLFHKSRKESGMVSSYEQHRKMGETQWVLLHETSYAGEMAKMEEDAVKARDVRKLEVEEKEKLEKVQAEKKMLLEKLAAKKKLDEEVALLEQARREVADLEVPKAQEKVVDEKPVEAPKKVWGKKAKLSDDQ